MEQEMSFVSPKISCGHCTRTIEREVGALAGVVSVSADASSKRVSVRWKEPPCSRQALEALLDEIGYPVESRPTA